MTNFIIKITGQEGKKDSGCCGVEIKAVEENKGAAADSCCRSGGSESNDSCCS